MDINIPLSPKSNLDRNIRPHSIYSINQNSTSRYPLRMSREIKRRLKLWRASLEEEYSDEIDLGPINKALANPIPPMMASPPTIKRTLNRPEVNTYWSSYRNSTAFHERFERFWVGIFDPQMVCYLKRAGLAEKLKERVEGDFCRQRLEYYAVMGEEGRGKGIKEAREEWEIYWAVTLERDVEGILRMVEGYGMVEELREYVMRDFWRQCMGR